MDLYNEKINEFTDWVNGTNSLTGGIDTIGDNGQALPVSGGKNQRTIIAKTTKPIFVYRDNTAHLTEYLVVKRLGKLWQTDPDKYSKILEINKLWQLLQNMESILRIKK